MKRHRKLRLALAMTLVLPVVLLVLAILVLHNDRIATRLVNSLAARVSPWTSARLTVQSASVTGTGGLILRNVRLANENGDAMATIDTAALHISPLQLIRRAVVISSARIVGADVTLRQRPDSAWDLLQPFLSPAPDSGQAREIRIDDAEIVRSRIEAHYVGTTDSLLRVESINIRVPRYRAGTELSVDVDSLSALIYPASRPNSAATLAGRFSLDRGQVTADSVRLLSDSSRVLVNGTLLLPGGEEREVTDIDFHVDAQPLDFRDIGSVVPGFDVPGSLRLTARFTGTSRAVAFTADGRTFDGATLNAAGQIKRAPGDSVRYFIDAHVRDIDPHLWAAAAPSSRVDADAKVALAGATPESIDGTVLLKIGRTPYGKIVILPSTVEARFDNGTAYYTARGGVAPWASIDGSGKARPFDKIISADFTGSVRQLADTTLGGMRIRDIAAFVRATWKNREIDARTNISRGFVGGAEIDTANATIHYETTSFTVATTLATSAGRILFDGGASQINSKTPAWTVNRVKLSDVDLAQIDTTYPVTRLNGEGSGNGHGTTAAAMNATAHVVMASSRINDQVIDSANVDLTLRDGNVATRGTAAAPRGRATFVAAIEPFTTEREFDIHELNFADLAIDSAGTRRLSGRLVASGAIPRDTFPRVSGTLDVDPTPLTKGHLASARATFTMAGDTASTKAVVRTGKGTVDVTASAALGRSATRAMRIVRGHAQGTAHLPDLGDFTEGDTLPASMDAAFNVDADGTDPAALAWSANVTANGKYGGAVIDTLSFNGRLANGLLHLDTLLLRSNIATGSGGGVIAVASNVQPPEGSQMRLRVDADSIYAIDQLLPLQNFSLRAGHLAIDATNSNGGIDAKTSVAVLGLISPGAWADSMQLNGTARIENRKLTGLNAKFAGNDLGYGTAQFAATRGTLEYAGSEAKFTWTLTGDTKHSITTSGTLLPSTQAITFADMTVQVDSTPWIMKQPSTVTLGPRINVQHFELVRGSRSIAIDGVIDRSGTQNFSLVLDSVPVQGFAEFAGFTGVDGMLDGSIRLAGPARNVALNVDLGVLLLGTRGHVGVQNAGDHRMQVDAQLTDAQSKTLAVQGTIPLSISLAAGDSLLTSGGPLALTARADSFSIAWLAPLTRPFGVTRLAGAFRSDLKVAGTFADPAMSGAAGLIAASVSYPQQGVSYHNIDGDFTLEGDRIHVNSMRLVSEGTATLTGDVVMETAANPTLNVEAQFDKFRAAKNEWTRLGITGQAHLTGELLAPKITGRLQLNDTDLYADAFGSGAEATPVELTKEDLRMLEFYFGYDTRRVRQQTQSVIEPWEMDLHVTVGSNTWLRRARAPEMRVQLDGSLDVKKAAHDSIQMFGSISVQPTRSYFSQFGKRFDVTSGSVTFNGPLTEWNADFNARYMVPSIQDPGASEATITLNVTGSVDSLHLTLGSDPTMETADIVSYLAVGRPASSAAELGGGDAANFGASLAAGQLSSLIENAAGKSIGLDVVEVRHNGIEGATIVAGRYVNSRLFVGFEQPLVFKSENDNKVTRAVDRTTQLQLEYRLYRWLLSTLEGNQSSFSFLFRGRRAF